MPMLSGEEVKEGLPVGVIDLAAAKIVVLNPKNKIMANAADMLVDEIEKRTRITLDVFSKMPADGDAVVLIGTAQQLARKSYRPPSKYAVPQKTDGYSLWTDTTRRKAATICAAGYDDMAHEFHAVPQHDIRADDAVVPDLDVRAELGARLDDRRGMSAHLTHFCLPRPLRTPPGTSGSRPPVRRPWRPAPGWSW